MSKQNIKKITRYIKQEKESQGETRISLKLNVIKNMMASILPLKKQNQIAHTLSNAQHEIELLQQLVEKYKIKKRGVDAEATHWQVARTRPR